MSKAEDFKPRLRYIAYFDILGYKSKIGKNGENASELAQLIDKNIEKAKKTAKHYLSESDERSLIKLKAFSDNIILCTETNWAALFAIAADFQSNMIEDGLFIRGALCHSELVFREEFVCGQGIILANEIESEVAIFPRIIVHNSWINATSISCKEPAKDEFEFMGVMAQYGTSTVFADFDGYEIIDYLMIKCHLTEEREQKLELLKRHKNEIIKNIKNANSQRIKQKFLWCANYHNERLDIFDSRGALGDEYYIEYSDFVT